MGEWTFHLTLREDQIFIIDYMMLSKSTLPQIAGNSACFASKQSQIRSRRVSMGAKVEANPSSASFEQAQTPFRRTSLIKLPPKQPNSSLHKQKSRKCPNLTKMCQHNLNEFLTLRRQISRHYPQPAKDRIKSQRTSDESPKLTINQLNLTRKYRLTKVKCNIPNKVQAYRPLIIKTDPSQPPSLSRKIRCHVVPYERKFFSTSKKYSELSLREIIESEAEVKESLYQREGSKGRYQSMAKLSECADAFQPLGGW